jgi:hypothetical protein
MSEKNKKNVGNYNSGNGNSGNDNSGDYNSGNDNSGDYNSGNGNSGNYNSGYYNSGNDNSGHNNSGNGNSGNDNSGDYNSGNGNSGNYNSGYGNSGNDNSGDYNSGNGNSGFFNTIIPSKRIFNKEIQNNSLIVDFIDLTLNQWISENQMTEKEKKDNPKFFVQKGYLKTIPYKEAWKVFWNKASKETKNKIKNLPFFNAEIFYDITGINIEVNLNKQKEEMINEAKKLLEQGKTLLEKAEKIYCGEE